jgi:acyl carrier protein
LLSAQGRIVAEIGRLLSTKGDATPSIDTESDLVALGLTSLNFAELLIVMETELGVDPFQGNISIVEMQTVGDLVQAYDAALGAGSARG